MKRTVLTVMLTALLVGGGAYAMGRSTGGSEADASATVREHTEAHSESSAAGAIQGAGHVHAVTQRPDGSLLLGSHGGLYRSADDGATWTPVEVAGDIESTDFMNLVAAPGDANVIFAGGHGLGVVRSSDGGATWERADQGIDGTDIHGLTINQRDSDYLYAYSVGHGVYRSDDGGQSWHRLDDGPQNPSVRSFAYMAVETDMDRSMGSENWGLLFAGTADGVHDSYSCFCGWRQSSEQLRGITTYSLATVHEEPRTMYAGTTDGVWKTTDAGASWQQLDGIDGRVSAVSIDPADPAAVVAVTEPGAVYRSRDAGETWRQQN